MSISKRDHLIAWLVIICFSLVAFSIYTKTRGSSGKNAYTIDLDNDGKDEIIRIKRLKVEVLSLDENKLGEFGIFDYSDKMQFVDLNKDGYKQIALWSQGKEGYVRSLIIHGLKDQKLYEIFKLEVNGSIDADFESRSPMIKTGWATWVWDGVQFVQDSRE